MLSRALSEDCLHAFALFLNVSTFSSSCLHFFFFFFLIERLKGLAVMGENLVLNMANHGFSVSVYNRTTQKVKDFVGGRGKGKSILGAMSERELVAQLKSPRKIMIMVQAGGPVDAVIEALVPLLDQGCTFVLF